MRDVMLREGNQGPRRVQDITEAGRPGPGKAGSRNRAGRVGKSRGQNAPGPAARQPPARPAPRGAPPARLRAGPRRGRAGTRGAASAARGRRARGRKPRPGAVGARQGRRACAMRLQAGQDWRACAIGRAAMGVRKAAPGPGRHGADEHARWC